MNETHLDLFSGIGGFAIAAREAGFSTIAFCESDKRCRTFLEKRWGLPVEPDIRKLDGARYSGISLLTGGPPCQPSSRAGKQGGAGDDRWLWPEALRVLAEAKPDSVVFENPLGIGDVGLDGILSEMGRLGYEGAMLRYSGLCRGLAATQASNMDRRVSGRLRERTIRVVMPGNRMHYRDRFGRLGRHCTGQRKRNTRDGRGRQRTNWATL